MHAESTTKGATQLPISKERTGLVNENADVTIEKLRDDHCGTPAAAFSPPRAHGFAAMHAWQKSTKTALCLIPDESLWPDIQSIRGVHDAHFVRWMPHINILFPFVSADQMRDAAELLAAKLASTSPFEISFDDIGVFSHSARSHTFWLDPRTANGTEIAELHKMALEIFPSCDDKSERQSGFCPHLSLGQSKGRAPDMAKLASLWPGGKFTCSRVFLLARSAFEDPFHVKHVVHLGSGGSAHCDWMYTADEDTYWCDAATGRQSMHVP
jgi:2'-5' RNA ligase